jgi:hypothetical protein
MHRFLDDDSVLNSGNELRLTTVRDGSAEEGHQQSSASKVNFFYLFLFHFLCTQLRTAE